MATKDIKPKAVFHGFPGDGNVEVKNLLSNIERTFLDIGSKIGKYQIIEEIDRGGMAVVYKAYQDDLDRNVALKVLPANITINNRFVDRFLAEAHSIAQLHHPNIVTIYEISVEENIYFLAMEYIPGKNLFYYLNQEKPKLVNVLEIVRKLADALDYAHTQKILHRDLKLNNVIMKNDNEPVLIDFGLAKVIGGKSDNLTKTGEIIGSPAYMAPERIFGQGLDARSDICSLGIMLYEMLTFKNPYLDPRSMIQTTKNVVEATPIPPRNLILWLPVEVESITLKAMRGDPEERYQSMKQFSEDIQRYQRGEPIMAKAPSLWSKVRRFFRKHWAILVNSLIVLMFSALIVWIVNVQSEKSRSRWQIVFSETFNKEESLANWFAYTGGESSSTRTGEWKITDSSLHVESRGHSYLRLENPFTTDTKIEFDIIAGSKSLFNTGFFICGTTPVNGYCFHIHRESDMLNAITYPESEVFFHDYKQVEFPFDSQYHVSVEKKDHIITFSLNDIIVSKIYDFFPIALGKEYQRIGFFVNGGNVIFDNLKIYRQAVPRLARPTIIADRFWEQGDFEAALNEYKEVLIDHSRSDIARQIRFRMVDCLIRIRDFEEAAHILSELENVKKINESERAKILFLRGIADDRKRVNFEKTSDLITLAGIFPASPFNKSAAAYKAIDCYNLFALGELDSAESLIEYVAKKYPEFSSLFGNVHVKILEDYIINGKWMEAKQTIKKIEKLYIKNEEVLFVAKILIAKGHLGRREKNKAIDVLNQCLASVQASVSVWNAWMILGEVYEYDHNFRDAFMIYQKVFNECSKNLPASWMARVRMGELAHQSQSNENLETIFRYVIDEPHVFAEPRLVAQFYTDEIKLEDFIKQWLLINTQSSFYFYHLSQKAIIDEDTQSAYRYLTILKKLSPPLSWEFVRASRMIDDLYARGGLKKK